MGKRLSAKRQHVEEENEDRITDSGSSSDSEVDDDELLSWTPAMDGSPTGTPTEMMFTLPFGGTEFHLPSDAKDSWKLLTGLTMVSAKYGQPSEEEAQPREAFILSNGTDHVTLCKFKGNGFWYLRFDSKATSFCVLTCLKDSFAVRYFHILLSILSNPEDFDEVPAETAVHSRLGPDGQRSHGSQVQRQAQ
jgi:hypothetical protein